MKTTNPPESSVETINELAELNVVRDVCHGQRKGVEENIKTGITNDMLEALGWNRRTQMDFEHNVGSKSADIALIKDGTTKVIVETKSLEKKLEDYKSQGLEYARKEGIVWTVMTNGLKTQLYKSSIEGVPDSQNEPIFESTLQELPEKFTRLYTLIGEDNIDKIEEETSETVEYIRKKISEKEFLDQLLESKQELYYSLREEFDNKYGSDEAFTESVDEWVENNEFNTDWDWKRRFRSDSTFARYIQKIVADEGLKTTKTALTGSSGKYRKDDEYRNKVNRVLRNHGIPLDWKDKLCNQGAYSFVNRVLFLRMYEDRVEGASQRLNENWLGMLEESVDSDEVVDLLNLAFRQISDEFAGMYERPLFDGIYIDEIEWDLDVVYDIVDRTQSHDFSSVDSDILGEVYQNHIPKEVRKALGQFYTNPNIIRYMINRVDSHLTETSKVIDPACGSGSFLIELYTHLKEKMVAEGWGETAAHQHILSEVLYGVDIDHFATELTTMNLLIRDLDNPENADNIVTGNSVTPLSSNLGALYTTESPAERVKESGDVESEHSMFSLLRQSVSRNSTQGFDVVIGNPPYFNVAKGNTMPLAGTTYKRAIELEYDDVTDGRANIASLFIKRGLDLLKPNQGVLTLVLPKPMLYASGYRKLREYILSNCKVVEITDIGKAWAEVGYEQCIMFLEPEQSEAKRKENKVRVVSNLRDVDYLEYGEYTEHYIDQSKFYEYDFFPIYLSTVTHPDIEDVWETMWDNSLGFDQLHTDVFRGLGIQGAKYISDTKEGVNHTPILRGRHLGGDTDETGESWYVDVDDVEYVNTDHDDLAGKNKTTRLRKDKIICKRLVSSDVKIDATYDSSASDESIPYYNYDTIANIVVEDERIEDLYLLGVLTSNAITTYLRDLVFARAKLTMDLDEPYLSPLPIPDIPKTTDDESVSQQDIVDVVSTLIETKTEMERRGYSLDSATDGYLEQHSAFNTARRRLQQLVYEAYGLDADQIETLTEVHQLDL